MARTALPLSEAIDNYLRDVKSRGGAESTYRGIATAMRVFTDAIEQSGRASGRRGQVLTSWINHDCITRYFTTDSQSVRNARLFAVRGFLRYGERTDAVPGGSYQKLLGDRKHKSVTRKPKHYIPASQFGELKRLAGLRHPSERMAIAMALYTLARVSEISATKLEDLQFDNQAVRMWRGKRQRWTHITMCPELLDELDTWLPLYAEETGCASVAAMLEEHPDWHVVPHIKAKQARGTGAGSKHGGDKKFGATVAYAVNPLRPMVHMEFIVKRALDGLPTHTTQGLYVHHVGEGMHTIRRSGARAMLNNLKSLPTEDGSTAMDLVRSMLDHEDARTTLRYIGVDETRAALNEFLKAGSMYGTAPQPGGTVLPFRAKAG